ncbi:hypothetical protein [Stieleria varia]|uniref:Uncharacterized protein n=1 Tax=Stieleria varia TaxID=2528005 RepID=A0A5C6A1U5_9BACT|nr:hypothetical protein [Stieleria varia]TWT93814.1 hypothetical protein Pla52n_56420 [Stieleria varia]
METAKTTLSDDEAWFVASRWQQLAGEHRANHLRILAIVAFYLVHLVQHYQPGGLLKSDTPPDQIFHVALTVIVAGWLLMALTIDFSLRLRIFPLFTPYVTTGLDLALLTAILCLGGGQASPLILGYFLILILSALRFSLPLVRAATAAAIVSYLYLLAMGKWPHLFGDRIIGVVPRYHQIITLLAIGITGIVLGQMIRRFRAMAKHYAERRFGRTTDEQ